MYMYENLTNDYVKVAKSKSWKLFNTEVRNCINRCEILLENWDKIENTEYPYIDIDGISWPISKKDGICSNVNMNAIGLELKYSIFLSWDKLNALSGRMYSLLYPVDGEDEYDNSENLFKNCKRKELLIYFTKCLNEVIKAIEEDSK